MLKCENVKCSHMHSLVIQTESFNNLQWYKTLKEAILLTIFTSNGVFLECILVFLLILQVVFSFSTPVIMCILTVTNPKHHIHIIFYKNNKDIFSKLKLNTCLSSNTDNFFTQMVRRVPKEAVISVCTTVYKITMWTTIRQSSFLVVNYHLNLQFPRSTVLQREFQLIV